MNQRSESEGAREVVLIQPETQRILDGIARRLLTEELESRGHPKVLPSTEQHSEPADPEVDSDWVAEVRLERQPR